MPGLVAESLLRIGELSRRSGFSVDVIRAWERRYDLLRPTRTDGGYRLYSADDISRLRLMRHYLGRGIPTSQAAGLVHRVQTAALDANPGVPPGDVHKALRVLRDSLERFDDAPADRMLERLLGVFAAGAVLRDVVLPYLREVGERWACGEATIAQEHFASNFLEGWMHTMARGWTRSGRYRAVLACVPGERHALGLMAFGLALHDLGWRITYLGADVPVPAVEHAADAVAADVVVLSAARPATLAAELDDLRHLARTHAVAVGGAGATTNRSEWIASRSLPTDPIIAAHALTAPPGSRRATDGENRRAPRHLTARPDQRDDRS
jgi:MerR family transcriptional regulator, light-induced transcriptional regulator